MVHVDLENLIFGEQMFELEGQQNFINFAGVCFFSGQINIARHLHGDGRCALAFAFAQVGNARPDEAQIVQPAVLVKARILDRQHSVFHDLRNFSDGGEVATLFAKLAHQGPVCRVNAQR